MRLDYAFLANAAEISGTGLFSVLGGGIDIIDTPAFPSSHPSLALILRLRVESDELYQDHRVEIILLDSKETMIFPETHGTFHPIPKRSLPSNLLTPFTAVVHFSSILFPEEGIYAFHIRVDLQKMGIVPLLLRLSPTETGPEKLRAN